VTVDLSQESGQVQTVNSHLQLAIYGQIENLIGSSGNDTLLGNSADNSITGGPGDDVIDGGAGNDTYVFADGWGADTLTDPSGNDTLDFSAVTSDVNLVFTIANPALNVTDGTDTVAAQTSQIENLVGGQGNDTFAFAERCPAGW
jgi:Ca2+-binding RTX toxin-like protein